MSDLKICRICLRTEAKTYQLDRFQLRSYYEEVMALKMYEGDPLPQCACFECAALLHKFHRFKEKCYSGYHVLKEILLREPLSYEAVYNIDRTEKKLQSPLDIISVTERVKYYYTREENFSGAVEKVSKHCNKTELDSSHIDNNYVEEDPAKVITDKDSVSSNTKIYLTNDKEQTLPHKQTVQNHVEMEFSEIMEIKSVIVTDIKSESAVDMPVPDPVGIESDDTEMVPVIEFIDIKREGVRQEQLPSQERRDKQKGKRSKRRRRRTLDPAQWRRETLSEAEALRQFRARCRRPRYLAAAAGAGAGAQPCRQCYRVFRSQQAARRHARRHSEGAGAFACRVCRLRFASASALVTHCRAHFRRLHCLRCPRVFALENTALLHQEMHSGLKMKCPQCGQEFRHRCSLYAHVRAAHRSAHVCRQCGAAAVSARGLRRHSRLAHAPGQESEEDDDEVSTHCARCDMRFASRAAFREHLFQSARHALDMQDNTAGSRKILGKRKREKILKEWSKNNSAPEEAAAFEDDPPPEPKRRKKQKKLKTKPTTCYQCGQHFATQAGCRRHHVAAHPRTSFYPPAARHVCERCGASLAPSSVAAHHNMHSRERLHRCATCGRDFHAAVGLARHLVTHTGEKRFACPQPECGKRFTQNNSMKLHYRTAHLHQPYPKRNRRRNPPAPAPAPAATPPPSSPAQYLTLT